MRESSGIAGFFRYTDWKVAGRRLLNAPAFALFSILTIGMGVAAPTAALAVLDAARIPQTGASRPEELVNIYHSASGGRPMRTISLPDFLDYRQRQRQLSSVTAWAPCPRAWVGLDDGRGIGACELVDGDYFRTLEVGPAVVGRVLEPRDDRPGAPPVFVLGERTWKNVFGGRLDIVGSLVSLGDVRAEVVGVVPEGFRGLVDGGLTVTDLWVPLNVAGYTSSGTLHSPSDRDGRWLMVKGRLPPAGSLHAVAEEVGAIGAQLDDEYPIGLQFRDSPHVSAFEISRQWVVRRANDVAINESAELFIGRAWPLLVVTMCLVLIATCMTVGSMTLARARERQLESAIRSALGASRLQLTGELLIESMILCVLAGGLGLVIGLIASQEIARQVYELTEGVMQVQPALTSSIAFAALAATLIALVVTGVIPARRATDHNLIHLLARADATRVLLGWAGRRVLLAGQVALSFVLVATAWGSATAVRRLSDLDGGIRLERLGILSIDFDLDNLGRAGAEGVIGAWLDRIQSREGVLSAAVTTGLPFGPSASGIAVRAVESADRISVAILGVTPGLFDTFGLRMLEGRSLSSEDESTSARVVVVSEDAAMRLWGHTEVVGKVIALDDDSTATVVGVTTPTDTGSLSQRDFAGTVYAPLAQRFTGATVLIARSATTGDAVLAPMRDALADLDPQHIAVQTTSTMNPVRSSAATGRTVTAIAGVLAAFSGAIALVGLFGALSYAVAVRAKEIGVRLAIGASPVAIGWMVLRQGLTPVAVGLTATIPIIAVLLQSSLLPRSARTLELAPLFLVAAAFLAVAALACAPMVIRSMRTSPSEVLRRP